MNDNSTDTTGLRAASRLKAAPGQWQEVSRHSTNGSAKATASRIRNGAPGACWRPRGSFQTRWEADGDQFVVFARYAPDADDLAAALAEALHEANAIEIRILDRGSDGTPTHYRAVAWSSSGAAFYSSPRETAIDALNRAIDLLRAASGKGTKRIVDFAKIEVAR